MKTRDILSVSICQQFCLPIRARSHCTNSHGKHRHFQQFPCSMSRRLNGAIKCEASCWWMISSWWKPCFYEAHMIPLSWRRQSFQTWTVVSMMTPREVTVTLYISCCSTSALCKARSYVDATGVVEKAIGLLEMRLSCLHQSENIWKYMSSKYLDFTVIES